jgi:hypothetical protein
MCLLNKGYVFKRLYFQIKMGGSLQFEEIKEATQGRIHQNIRNFVETGTYKGDTTLMASKHFDKVFTTEIYEPLYVQSKKRAEDEGVSNIQFCLGNSVDLLKDIVPQVLEGAVFFIDAHISGNDSSWNQVQRVPLLEELSVILENKLGPSLFVIDDIRFWNGKKNEAWDWSHISSETVIELFEKYDYDILAYYESNDRFFVLTK